MKSFYLARLIIPIAILLGWNCAVAQTTFSTAGGPYSYTVPAGVTTIGVDLAGAQGGTWSGVAGGLGGRVTCNLSVTPGVLTIYVGGTTTSNTAGVNGGGSGNSGGAGGGGASDIRTTGGGYTTGLNSRLVVGGGGGGSTYYCYQVSGGTGGYPNGTNGTADNCWGTCYVGNGASTGGGGAGASCGCGNTGTLGSGGNGGCGYAGGGGGGYYGGGGGYYGPGGGGTSWASPTATSVQYFNGSQTSSGYVIIYGPSLTTTKSSLNFNSVTAGTTSVPAQYFAMNGTYMGASPLVIAPPANYEVSKDGVNWVAYPSTLNYTYTPPNISSVAAPYSNIYVKFLAPSTPGTYCGNISITGGGLATPVLVNVCGNSSPPCSGALAAGSAVATPSSGGSATQFTLSLSGASTGGGLTYQWQSSPTGTGSWTDIPGAIQPTYSFTGITAATFYRCNISCPGGSTGTSGNASITVQGLAAAGCTPAGGSSGLDCFHASVGSGSYPFKVAGATTLSDPAPCGASAFTDNTASAAPNLTCVLTPGQTYTVSVGANTGSGYKMSAQVWIDSNNDGSFASTEIVCGQGNFLNTPQAVLTQQLPSTMRPGKYRLRVSVTFSGGFAPGANPGYPCYPQQPACPTNAIQYVETRDYMITVGPGPCSGTPLTGISDVSATAGCAGFTSNLFDVGSSQQTGITYQWMQSTTSGSGYFNSPGASANPVYTATLSAVGTLYYVCMVSCGANSAYTNEQAVTENPPPAPISGSSVVCTNGGTTLLSSSPSTGTWTSNNTALATVGSNTGIVTGVAVGPGLVITYTLPVTGCTAVLPMTVNPAPTPIGGTLSVCTGLTTTLTDSVTGGAWVSGTPTAASVGSLTGTVTGVAPLGGTASIIYTLPDNCSVSTTVTVNPLPGTFIETTSGSTSYCAGSPSTADIRLSGSATGINYALNLGGVMVNTISGTGGPLDFGVQTATGVYNIVGTNNITGCVRTMAGAQTVSTSPLPIAFPVSVTGGGTYCAGATGSAPSVVLAGSQSNVNYVVWMGGVPQTGSIPGSGAAMIFGPFTAPGTYTIIGTSTAGCTATMAGSAIIIVNPLPTVYNVLGGGNYCAGGSGVDISLSYSNTGVTYTLTYGPTTAGIALGTGLPIDFGLQAANGTYVVTAVNNSTGCTSTMSGSPSVFMKSLPNAYAVSGGGSYCAGGAGVNVCINPTDAGVNYQLYSGTTPIGSPQTGTGLSLCFGNQTAAGTYTVVATDVSSLPYCTNAMTGSAVVSINSAPAKYNMTPGGNYCAGGTGVNVGLLGSNTGVTYQLFNSWSPIVPTMLGTGGAISFGSRTATGTYTIVATGNTTGCVDTMNGSSTVGINPLPNNVFNVTTVGTGAYCSGGTGVDVGLSFSETGVNYQLYRTGSLVGGIVAGTSFPLDFGNQTVAGLYTVGATNAGTGCTATMTGSATITINPLPASHLLTGGGAYCNGGTGIDVGLNGSNTGIKYQLYLGAGPVPGVSPIAGTGSSLDFGLQLTGGTYTVIATDTVTGCIKSMTGGSTVIVNALPAPYNVTGGGIYCVGGTGVHVGLSGSASGVKYQLLNGGVPTGSPFTGTGSPIDFGAQLASGSYTVFATNNSTTCTNTMTGSATIATNAAPAVYVVAGGGSYCAGGSGADVNLSSSDNTINYQLMMGITPVGSPMPGNGGALDFGMQTTVGTYKVVATNATTGCSSNMAGSATVTINSLPSVYNVTGGGGYCAGGAGRHIFQTLSNTGISYQLYLGGSAVGGPVAGTGAGLDFGAQPGAGVYTVVATNNVTTCQNNMAGSATVSINPLPGTHAVIGGGAYCPGGTGATIGLDGSDAGITYELIYGISPVGASVSGSGATISFGLHTTTGTYTAVAIDNITGCSSNMTGSANVSLATPPTAYSVTGGGTYCATGIGVVVGISNSDLNVNYQLYNGSAPSGIPLPGTGGAISFGHKTATGTYTIVATDAITGCTSNMGGTAVINVNPVVLPHVNVTPSIIGTVCTGQTISFSAAPVNGGTAPTFQWMVNGISAAVGSTYSYVPLNGDVVTATIHSNAICAIPDTGSSSMTLSVSPMEMPSATVSANPGTLVCNGTQVTFTATPLYGGLTPSLVWVKNGVAAGTGTTYTYTPNNGDIVTFMLGSNFNCRLADTVFSAPQTLQVQNPVIPTVAVTSNAGTNLALLQPVTFSAAVTHGGPALSYQWVVNATVIPGATNATYSTTGLAGRDSVTCEVEGVCGLIGFNSVIVTVTNVGVKPVTSAGSDVRLVPNPNKGEFTLKGTLGSAIDEEVTVEVMDMLGQVIYTNKVMTQNGSIDQHIKLNGALANGMYLLNLRSATDHTVFHFVIEQ